MGFYDWVAYGVSGFAGFVSLDLIFRVLRKRGKPTPLAVLELIIPSLFLPAGLFLIPDIDIAQYWMAGFLATPLVVLISLPFQRK